MHNNDSLTHISEVKLYRMQRSSDRTKQLSFGTKSIENPEIHPQTYWNNIGRNKVSQEVLDFSSSGTSMISTKGLDGSLGIKVPELQTNDGNDVGSYKNGEPKTRLTNSGISKVCFPGEILLLGFFGSCQN